jgi:hypothetical protein
MATKGVSIGEILIKLDRPAEEFNGCFMLSLETVAIADYTPSFRSK